MLVGLFFSTFLDVVVPLQSEDPNRDTSISQVSLIMYVCWSSLDRPGFVCQNSQILPCNGGLLQNGSTGPCVVRLQNIQKTLMVSFFGIV